MDNKRDAMGITRPDFSSIGNRVVYNIELLRQVLPAGCCDWSKGGHVTMSTNNEFKSE